MKLISEYLLLLPQSICTIITAGIIAVLLEIPDHGLFIMFYKQFYLKILAKQNAWDVASPFGFALSFQCCIFLLALTPAKHLMPSSWQRFTCGVLFEKTFTSCILKPVHTRVHCFLPWAVDTAGPVPTVMLSEMDSQKDTAREAALLAFTFLPVSRNFTTLRRSCACVAKSLILTGTFL